MGDLDPIVARVLLKGDDEFISSLKKVGEDGAESIHKIYAAMAQKGPVDTLISALTSLEAAISGVAAATILFIEQQTELSQKTTLLAAAFGTTAGQLQDLEAVFASSGVKVEQFERFANRLTITIAREWPAITESIKTYADQNDAAQLRVTNATLRVHDAQNAVMDGSAERASRAEKDNQAVEASLIRLQFAAREAASAQVSALQSVQGAVLGAAAARQHLAELQGAPPSAAEKQALQIAQAQEAVAEADQKVVDAKLKQEEQAAEAQLKRRELAQANADLERKAAKDARDDAEQRIKEENAVKSAIIERGEAEEKLGKLALTAIPSIRSALDGVVKGNKDAASAINLTQVSVENLTKGIIAQAAETSKKPQPEGYELLIQLSKTLSKATSDQISEEQKLAIINKLAATGMTALAGVGAELLDVIEHSNSELQKFSEQAKALDTKEAKENIEQFRGALAGINLTISILSQRFAIAISPAFTAFLRGLQHSIEDTDGAIHRFISGIIAVADAIVFLITKGSELATSINKWLGTDNVKDFKIQIAAIGIILAVAFAPLLVVPAAIVLIITALGALRDHWDEVKEAASRAFDVIRNDPIVKFVSRMADEVERLARAWGLIGPKAGSSNDSTGGKGTAVVSGTLSGVQDGFDSSGQPTVSRAGGGMIDGPGSHTSDSIVARLSRGEFVMKAAAVQQFGANFMHAINNGFMPGFAAGGMVPSPVRMGSGGSLPATSTLNLSIDGRSFGGLRGPKSTVDDLTSFAISRQTSQAGNKPSWYK